MKYESKCGEIKSRLVSPKLEKSIRRNIKFNFVPILRLNCRLGEIGTDFWRIKKTDMAKSETNREKSENQIRKSEK